MIPLPIPSYAPDPEFIAPVAEVRHVTEEPDDGDEPDVLPMTFDKRNTKFYRNRLVELSGECVYCGCKLTYDTATVEHAIPQSQGGGHQPWNLWIACSPCNSERSSRSLPKWVAEMRRDAENLVRKADRIERAARRMGVIPPDAEEMTEV